MEMVTRHNICAQRTPLLDRRDRRRPETFRRSPWQEQIDINTPSSRYTAVARRAGGATRAARLLFCYRLPGCAPRVYAASKSNSACGRLATTPARLRGSLAAQRKRVCYSALEMASGRSTARQMRATREAACQSHVRRYAKLSYTLPCRFSAARQARCCPPPSPGGNSTA